MAYNLAEYFKEIDRYEAANLFFWQVPEEVHFRDGISLILYRNLRLLNYYNMNFQKKQFASMLHRFRVLLRRTTTLLETFSHFYDADTVHEADLLLEHYYEETKLLRYLYFMGDLCATRENISLTLYSELKDLIVEEEQVVTPKMLALPFVQMIERLTREVKGEDATRYISVERGAKEVVRDYLGRLEILLEKTREGYDAVRLESLYLLLDTLQTLIEDMFHLFGKRETEQLVEELNILLKPLREYRNCKERETILTAIKERSKNKGLDVTPLLCQHKEALEEKIAEALKLLRSSRFYI
ncbi:MAG TPA: hypothetical protein ENK71_00295 [Epsilonproteobacteria bacterium]|nr:hypothetical protein [Campylobacterota bacterium]